MSAKKHIFATIKTRIPTGKSFKVPSNSDDAGEDLPDPINPPLKNANEIAHERNLVLDKIHNEKEDPITDPDEHFPQFYRKNGATPRGAKPGDILTRAFTRDSAYRLRELMFDPMEEMVNLYGEISFEIRMMERIRAGIKKGTYSSQAHVTLIGVKQKLVNDLMRYGYARQMESIDIKTDQEIPPVQFTLVGVMPELSLKDEDDSNTVDAEIIGDTN